MIRLAAYLIICILFLGKNCKTFAQNALKFKHYTTENGLPHNIIYETFQDSKGYLWIGTDDGLVRFDGSEFKTYRTSDGLLSNYIISIDEGSDGTLWIGSWKGGVNCIKNDSIYQPNIESPLFRVGSLKVSDSTVLISDGRMYHQLYHASKDSWKLDTEKVANRFYITPDSIPILDIPILDIKALKNKGYINTGTIVRNSLVNGNKLLFYGDFQGVFAYGRNNIFRPFYKDITKQDTIYHVIEDFQKNIWMGGKGKIYKIDIEGNTTIFSKNIPNVKINDIEISSSGKIYFISGYYSLKSERTFYIFDTKTNKLVDLKHKLAPDALPAFISMDTEENLWLSTHGDGLYCIPHSSFDNISEINGNNNLFIKAIQEDNQGNLFIGTFGGLFQKKNNELLKYEVPGIKSSFEVVDLLSDKHGNLLVHLITDIGEKNARYYLINITDRNIPSVIGSGTNNMYMDKNGKLWYSARYNELRCGKYPENIDLYNEIGFDFEKGTLINQINGMDNKIAVSTNKGVFIVGENSDNTLSIIDIVDIDDGLIDNNVFSIEKENEEVYWIGTLGGLCRYEKEKITCYTVEDGLISNSILKIFYDQHGILWIGTPKGLTYFDGNKFTSFNSESGLVSSNINTLYQDRKKQLWIGTPKGISVLNNEKPLLDIEKPKVFIGEISINGRSQPQFENIQLEHNASFRINFNAPNFNYPEGASYQFRLNSGNWQRISTTYVDFNALQYGNYIFEVRVKKFNSDWSDPQSLHFEVLPPFWLRWWAILVYLLFAVNGVIGYVNWRSIKHKEVKQNLEKQVLKRTIELEQQKEEIASQAAKLKEMDVIKSNFFSNISHEFRTPLTLIIGPAEKMVKSIHESGNKQYAQSILNNANRLLKLINQLLDFSKLENGKMKLKPKNGNINSFLKKILLSFDLLAKEKGLKLRFVENQKDVTFYFDYDNLEKVFYNLLSNAIKFTLSGGEIKVKIDIIDAHLLILVEDTGIGINRLKLPYIFDRFYQADASGTREFEGTGIGLSLVKELVELHNGTIGVESDPGKGTSFILRFPFNEEIVLEEHDNDSELSENSKIHNSESEIIFEQDINHEEVISTPANGNTILIVEDNTELRKFISLELQPYYHTVEAADGLQGKEKAKKLIPDLIISDVMMPNLDGFGLLKHIRINKVTSHIPFIILTAKASLESKITGLESGTDEYLTKPFNTRELLLRIKNILDRRERFRHLFSENISKANIPIEPSLVTATSMDEEFLKNAIETVEKHIGNHNFDVTLFCEEMGMSRSGLFRKLKALLNLSTTEFIRSLRLKRAAQLLKQNAGRVDEIAFQVGFSDISYFIKCFKKQFDMSPKSYQIHKLNDD